MILYPAIDLLGGWAVRLRKGMRGDVTVYGDPTEIAKKLRDEGTEWLHLVDLEAAFEGETTALPLIERIVRAFGGPVELGGGIRTPEAIRSRFDLGVTCCILGTAAFEHPELVEEACKTWPGRIAAGIDAKDGRVALRGWVETADMSAAELALRMKRLGVARVIYTDVSRDGMMQGPNIAATRALVAETGMAVTGSGGVSRIADLLDLKAAGCAGAILGKALYEKAFTLPEALEAVRDPAPGRQLPPE